MWRTPFCSANTLNPSDVNWEPLSVTTCSGIPCRLNHSRKTSRVTGTVVDDMARTSGHFEKASTAMRNNAP